MADATEIALRTVRQFLQDDDTVRIPSFIACFAILLTMQVKRVIFVVFSAKDEKVYQQMAPLFFPPSNDYKPAPQD